MRGYAPTPLNPRDADSLVQHLSPGDRVRITDTDLPRTTCTVRETNPPTRNAPHLVLTTSPITTTAQDELQQITFHCLSQLYVRMTVLEYTHIPSETISRCIGSLTTIANLPGLSTPRHETTCCKRMISSVLSY
ncbi:hypothetical protein ACFFQF_32755 [Haladaptatus pallidirubidus]|uniref:hypothetical protein n=1 Tax=Haladaptatus pallidirubidus TaxID=1008152 RepID=UPI0035ECB0CD